MLDPDLVQKEEKVPIKIETEVKPELKVKTEMVETSNRSSQPVVKLEPNALSKPDDKQEKNPEKKSTKGESVSSSNEDRTRGSHMAEVSSGLVWHKDYWVDKDTFDSMRTGDIPSKCPKCPKVFQDVPTI